MAFTIGSGTFTNGSATVTGVTLTSGTLAYFASGTRMVVGVNPVIQEVEAIAAPTVTTITLRSAWTGTGGTYSFLANQTSEGLRDAVQAIRTNNASLQSFIDSIDTAATANSVAQRDATGQLIATNLITADKIIHDGDTNTAIRFPANDTVTVETNGAERVRVDASGNVGIGALPTGERLSVASTTIYQFSFKNNLSSSLGALGYDSGDNMRVFANGAERMRISSSGNVGIGTTAPVDKIEAVSPVSVAYASGSAFIAPEGTKLRIANTASLDNSYSGITFSSVTSGNVTSISYIGSLATSGSTSGSIVFGQRTTSTYTERMRITSSGNVGIGTSSPSRNLEVSKADTGSFKINGTSNGGFIQFSSSGTDNYIGMPASVLGGSAVDMAFYTNTTERMRIDSSGNVLVGKSQNLNSIQGVAVFSNGQLRLTQDGTASETTVGFYRNSSGTAVGSITTTSTTTSYNTSSDYRLKEDWQPMEGSIDRLMQLKPCNFAWKIDGSRVDGFLAHEAQEVVPEAVHGTKDGMRTEQYEVSPAVYEDVVIPAELDEEGVEVSPERTEQQLVSEAVMGEREVPEYQGIDQSKIVPLLTAALQDAIKKIEALEARIEALEG